MKKISLVAALAGIFILSSCTGVYESMATSAKSEKRGEVKKRIVFGIGNADVSIAAAAKKGGITKISTVNTGTRWWVFGVTYCTVVTGE